MTRNPENCSVTAEQYNSARRACPTGSDNIPGPSTPGESGDSSAFVSLEKSLVTKADAALTNRLKGRILLQVQLHGEAWYVNPVDGLKYYLGRPADAFAAMRQMGLGVSEANYNSFVKNGVPSRLAGRILLRVGAKGEAYYVNPVDRKMHYLGRPADAFAVMRNLGLGITNANARMIGVGTLK